jgi:hypothetical protein
VPDRVWLRGEILVFGGRESRERMFGVLVERLRWEVNVQAIKWSLVGGLIG